MERHIVGVRFQPVGKIYHFDAGQIPDLKVGDHVVVETSRGKQLGQVMLSIENPGSPPEGGWKAIERLATPRDMLMRQSWRNKEMTVIESARQRAQELRLAGVKIIAAEYSYDGSRLTIYFGTETEEKVELKSLRQDMQKAFSPSQVDMRQIGPRDVAKVVMGLGACGLEKRCCGGFLTEFSSISIKMAKEQGISLTPDEITGMCGRLRCCLIYECEQYSAARQLLPKRGKRVRTSLGEGKVLDVYPLRESVLVEVGETVREFGKTDIELVDEPEPPRENVQSQNQPNQQQHQPHNNRKRRPPRQSPPSGSKGNHHS